jgi:hypothetical protein
MHRALLVVGTTLLAIAASRIAGGVSLRGSWVLIAGSGLVMILSDVLKEVEDASRELAASSGREPGLARRDMFLSRAPAGTVPLLLLGTVLIALGLTLTVTEPTARSSGRDQEISDSRDKQVNVEVSSSPGQSDPR